MALKTKKLPDSELLYLASEYNEDAINVLFEKYKYIVDITVNKYIRTAYSLNLDYDELYQEAMVGYSNAIRLYNDDKNIQLRTFISVCIERRLQNYIRNNSTNKMKKLKDAYSFDTEIGEDLVLADVVGDNKNNPEFIKEQDESLKELKSIVDTRLSSLEHQVFDLLINDFTSEDIAKILKTSTKNIYNITYRIRAKLKDII
jgi:RNA polymerase sigma factor (sigma-70 family)